MNIQVASGWPHNSPSLEAKGRWWKSTAGSRVTSTSQGPPSRREREGVAATTTSHHIKEHFGVDLHTAFTEGRCTAKGFVHIYQIFAAVKPRSFLWITKGLIKGQHERLP